MNLAVPPGINDEHTIYPYAQAIFHGGGEAVAAVGEVNGAPPTRRKVIAVYNACRWAATAPIVIQVGFRALEHRLPDKVVLFQYSTDQFESAACDTAAILPYPQTRSKRPVIPVTILIVDLLIVIAHLRVYRLPSLTG